MQRREGKRTNLRNTAKYRTAAKVYYGELHDMVDRLVPVVEAGRTNHQAAAAAIMAPTTLYNLRRHRTTFPQFWTVYRLAMAAGYKLTVKGGRNDGED